MATRVEWESARAAALEEKARKRARGARGESGTVIDLPRPIRYGPRLHIVGIASDAPDEAWRAVGMERPR